MRIDFASNAGEKRAVHISRVGRRRKRQLLRVVVGGHVGEAFERACEMASIGETAGGGHVAEADRRQAQQTPCVGNAKCTLVLAELHADMAAEFAHHVRRLAATPDPHDGVRDLI